MAGSRSYTVQINATPEQVFPWIGDFPRHAEWIGNEWKVEDVSGGSTGVGSKYRSTGLIMKRPNTSDVQITAHDPPRQFGFDATDKEGTFHTEYLLTPRDGGTLVERRITMTISPIRRVMMVLAAPLVKKDSMQSLNRLKEKVEGTGS